MIFGDYEHFRYKKLEGEVVLWWYMSFLTFAKWRTINIINSLGIVSSEHGNTLLLPQWIHTLAVHPCSSYFRYKELEGELVLWWYMSFLTFAKWRTINTINSLSIVSSEHGNTPLLPQWIHTPAVHPCSSDLGRLWASSTERARGGTRFGELFDREEVTCDWWTSDRYARDNREVFLWQLLYILVNKYT